ncbi:flexible cuticle protein 12-like [Adelges cooleyi]|uniref:flexible cuticle protein 12-like n=1 Tax=Adelges cooleyi TaxID=133065 RepID=UPI0021808A48|nr:flexible cuticle protein 12-like [Adelges cooleyi]
MKNLTCNMFAVLAVAAVLVNFCLAAPSPADIQNDNYYAPSSIKPPVKFLQNDHVSDEAGQFSLLYQTADGIRQAKQGALVANDEGNGYVLEQKGTYSFYTPDGVEVKMTYTAGKDGFKVQGYPLPVPQVA